MTNTIILTGAICPSWSVQRNDPIVRLTDYLCAIRRWLEVPALTQVIYCDASGCVIPEKVFESEKFESLSCDASAHAKKYEAGRAEAESLAFVLEKSRFRFDTFYKCTGRIFVKNLAVLQAGMKIHPEAELFLRKWYREDWADTRFFYMTTRIFKREIEPRIHELTGCAYGGHVIESLFFESMNQAYPLPEIVFIGYEGHSNQPYHADYNPQEKEQAVRVMEEYGLDVFGIHAT